MVKVTEVVIYNHNQRTPTAVPGDVFVFYIILKPRSGWQSKTVYVQGSKDGAFLELNTGRTLKDVTGGCDYQITHWAQLPSDAPADHFLMFNQEQTSTT
jgi:hypothetical protein